MPPLIVMSSVFVHRDRHLIRNGFVHLVTFRTVCNVISNPVGYAWKLSTLMVALCLPKRNLPQFQGSVRIMFSNGLQSM